MEASWCEEVGVVWLGLGWVDGWRGGQMKEVRGDREVEVRVAERGWG